MRVYAGELICSPGVLDFHTFKLALCIHNKLRSHAEMLSWWAFDVTFPGSNPLRSNRSGLNVSNGGSWNPKLTLKVNSLWIKMKGQNFSSQVLSRHTFRILRKKGSDFFDHRGTLNDFPSWLPTSKNQPFSWTTVVFIQKDISVTKSMPVWLKTTLLDGASFHRLTSLIGLNYWHQL